MISFTVMVRYQNLAMLPLTAIGAVLTSFLGVASHASPSDIGDKGASVYCFMRNSGNNHPVSWDAAYQIIKRQKSSLFKTSPKHAAVMITETVVQNPSKYQNCGPFVGDLFAPPNENQDPIQEEFLSEEPEMPSELKKGDRYSY